MAQGIPLDLTGKRIGILTVLEKAPSVIIGGKPRTAFKCKCDCGTIKIIATHYLCNPNRGSCGCKEYERKAKTPIECMYRYAKDRAVKYRTKQFELSLKEFENLSLGDCKYCGKAPANKYRQILTKGDKILLYNGIDRIDSSKGYTLDNCVTCCSICNTMKNSLTYTEFINHIKLLHTRLCS